MKNIIKQSVHFKVETVLRDIFLYWNLKQKNETASEVDKTKIRNKQKGHSCPMNLKIKGRFQ